jgi:two-component system cell cycle response regulator CpdR
MINSVQSGGKDSGLARILIAEDDAAVREFVSRALRHQGHDVTAVEDGLHALERMSANTYDLLITDIVMPGLDGIALALKAAKDYPDMAILMMTGYAAERQRAHNLEALIHQVISKPFSLQQICDAARDALDGRPIN